MTLATLSTVLFTTSLGSLTFHAVLKLIYVFDANIKLLSTTPLQQRKGALSTHEGAQEAG
jgi:hypothetical protein